ncbi:glutamate--tRNA ligase [Patescibacteria group bacterium]|nr:glutamate--tRNA ligase [Patescibacteria group bacterium]
MPLDDFKFIRPGKIRVRIAPSPTGLLHIGLARTALFNYLFAKKYQGNFVLRIEDTDIERSDSGFEEDIIENLQWLGIEWSEGPDIGGNFGPYRQSEKLPAYAKYIEKLLNTESAYRCFCSEDELEAKRQYAMSIGQQPRYNGKCSQLSSDEIRKLLAEGKKSIVRFRTPNEKVSFKDLLRGKIEFDSNLIGDFGIAKDLATPLYNLAVVVDDFEMKISHVIRGEDHIPNTPKQILLQKALEFPRPEYLHLPLILGPDRSKLSKRHGAFAIADYRKEGYLPEAIINFMAFLGWNPGGEREIYSMPSLIKEFSIERIQKGGAVFNVRRLDFLNGFYIRQKSAEKFAEICIPYLIEAGLVVPAFKSEQYPPAYGGMNLTQTYKVSGTGEEVNFNYLQNIVVLYQERLKKLSEISELTDFFFNDKLEYNKELLKWKEAGDREIEDSLNKLEKIISEIKAEDCNKEILEEKILPEAEKIGLSGTKDRGYLLWPFRVALTGKEASAGPFEVAEVLGKEKVLKRIREAKERL